MLLSKEEFLRDSQGAKFRDVTTSLGVVFDAWLAFFSDKNRQRRMEESEIHHDRPALSGVIKELERTSCFEVYLKKDPGPGTARGRQAIGVIVRLIMEKLGWKTSGKKGSLGRRDKKRGNGFENTQSSLSRWFTMSERYSNNSREVFHV